MALEDSVVLGVAVEDAVSVALGETAWLPVSVTLGDCV